MIYLSLFTVGAAIALTVIYHRTNNLLYKKRLLEQTIALYQYVKYKLKWNFNYIPNKINKVLLGTYIYLPLKIGGHDGKRIE